MTAITEGATGITEETITHSTGVMTVMGTIMTRQLHQQLVEVVLVEVEVTSCCDTLLLRNALV